MVTKYYLNLVAGNLLRTKTSPAIPTTYYIGLMTSPPNVPAHGEICDVW